MFSLCCFELFSSPIFSLSFQNYKVDDRRSVKMPFKQYSLDLYCCFYFAKADLRLHRIFSDWLFAYSPSGPLNGAELTSLYPFPLKPSKCVRTQILNRLAEV